MFPRLNEIFKSVTPQLYFGGEDAPTYNKLSLPANSSIQDIAQTIYDLAYNKNLCGYIANDTVNYFIDECGSIQIDSSKDFIFLADRNAEAFTHPTPFGIIRFLEDPCDKALFISEGSAFYIEKTPATYQLCVELDDIWDENEFYETIIETIDSEDMNKLQSLLSTLMKEYERRKYGSSTSIWDFVEENKDVIMEEKLFFTVQKLAVQEDIFGSSQ